MEQLLRFMSNKDKQKQQWEDQKKRKMQEAGRLFCVHKISAEPKFIAGSECYHLHGLISRLPDKRLGRRRHLQEKEGEEDQEG